jgi:hypothetical protein
MITGIKGSCSPTKIKARASLVERQNFNMVKKREKYVFWRCGNRSTYRSEEKCLGCCRDIFRYETLVTLRLNRWASWLLFKSFIFVCLITTCIWTVGRWEVDVFCLCQRWSFGKRARMNVPVRCGTNSLRCTLCYVQIWFILTKFAAKLKLVSFISSWLYFRTSQLVMFALKCYSLKLSGILNLSKF